MQTKEITLFVFDSKENFEKSRVTIGSEGASFKKLICVQNLTEFETEFAQLAPEDHAYMVVHVFYTDGISGIKRFIGSGISNNYPKLGFMYISEGDNKAINKMMVDEELDRETVYKYWQVQSNLADGKFPVFKKKEILRLSAVASESGQSTINGFTVDVAIIAALYDGEFSSLRSFLEDEQSVEGFESMKFAKLINSDKRVLVDFQVKMGMVEATFLATMIISRFSPKYLIMVGVCGGRSKKDVKLLDLLIPSKIFEFQTGKYDNGVFKPYMRACNVNNKKAIAAGPSILKSIEDYVQQPLKEKARGIRIHNKSMACGHVVIKTDGFLEDVISSADEETQGVEMESYGVVKAAELTEDKRVTPIIIKAVMDYTEAGKNDNDKDNAAYFSACFAYFLIKDYL